MATEARPELQLGRDSRGLASEYAVAICVVAIAGFLGFTQVGDAFRESLAGEADGARQASAATPVATGAQTTVSVQAAGVEVLVDAARGLYREVPLTLASRETTAAPDMLAVARALDTEGLSMAELARRTGDEAAAPLLHDLYTELFRLRDNKVLPIQWRPGVGEEAAEVASSGNDVLSALLELSNGGRSKQASQRVIDLFLDTARASVEEAGEPIPEAFFERIRTAGDIFRGRIDEFTRDRVFGRSGAVDSAAEELRAYPAPSGNPALFYSEYLADREKALGRLTPDARSYLEAEVLPILRETFVQEGEEGQKIATPYLTPEDEAELVARIVYSGGGQGVIDGFLPQLNKRTPTAKNLGELPSMVAFAPKLFEPAWVPRTLRRFSEGEAAQLIRYDAKSLARLRERPYGGEVIADLFEGVRNLEVDRIPGRSQAHVDSILRAFVRAAARGDFDEAARVQAVLERVVENPPSLLSESIAAIKTAFNAAD